MSNTQKSTFFGGAAILAVSSLLVKGIGALFRIPLGNILPDEVMGDYNAAYNIYNFFLTISTAGLPVALSKTISEANTLNRRNQMERIFRVAFTAFLTLGLISFFFMTVLSGVMADKVISNPKAIHCIQALAPSVLCVCVISSFRGYFQGHFNMWPTGVSQVIEALCKLLLGLALAFYFVKVASDPEMGSVGAIIGVSFGSVVALLFLIFIYLSHRRSENAAPAADRPDPAGAIFANLLRLAVPITIGSAATSLVTLIDTKLVMSQLQSVFHVVDGLAVEPDGGPALDAARKLYGIYSKTMSVYNLPFSMMVPLTACIIPAVSAALVRRDYKESRKVSESAIRVGLLVAMPMGMGLFALGGPIMGLLFPAIDTSVAGPLLSVLGLASIFVAIQLLCNSILQANGMVNLPILAVVVGGVTKIIINFILVGNPNIRIFGAPVGTLSCFVIIDVLEMLFIVRGVPSPPSFIRCMGKPFLASALMGAAAWACHGLLVGRLGNSIAAALGILAGMVVYVILVLMLRAISADDLALMPKGDKIAKILHIR